VQSRRKAARTDYPSVYGEFGNSSSFAVRYCESEQGSSLRILYAEVQRLAATQHQEKCAELAELKRQHHDLMERYNNKDCDLEVNIANEGEDDEGMFIWTQ
jgi:hypothetical protein